MPEPITTAFLIAKGCSAAKAIYAAAHTNPLAVKTAIHTAYQGYTASGLSGAAANLQTYGSMLGQASLAAKAIDYGYDRFIERPKREKLYNRLNSEYASGIRQPLRQHSAFERFKQP